MTISCGESFDWSEPTATDDCDEDVLITFTDTQEGDNCSTGGITRTWTATDDCGHSSSASQMISILDTEAPEILGVENDMTISCGESFDWSEPTATDDCDEDVLITYTDTQEGDNCSTGRYH